MSITPASNGVCMIGERCRTSLETTSKRLERDCASRARCSCEKSRLDVEEPTSTPTVSSLTLSSSHVSGSPSSSSSTTSDPLPPASPGDPPTPHPTKLASRGPRQWGRGSRPHDRDRRLVHPRLDAALPEFVDVERVDARVLILVLDLAPPISDADVHAGERSPLVFRERVAEAAEGHREVARRRGADVEMLVEHHVRRRVNAAVPPVDAVKVLVVLVPEQRVTLACDREDVEVSAVAVRLLVGANRHFRDVRVHSALGQHEHDVRPSRAPGFPFLQLEARKVGYKVRLPLMPTRPDRDEFTLSLEEVLMPEPVPKRARVVEHEVEIVERLEHQRHAGDRDQAGGARSRQIEVAVGGVERHGEEALLAPLERAGAPRRLDCRAARAAEHVDDLLEEVTLGLRLPTWWKLEDVHVEEVATSLDQRVGAGCAQPRPGSDLKREQVEPEVLMYRDALRPDEIEVRVDQVAGTVRLLHISIIRGSGSTPCRTRSARNISPIRGSSFSYSTCRPPRRTLRSLLPKRSIFSAVKG